VSPDGIAPGLEIWFWIVCMKPGSGIGLWVPHSLLRVYHNFGLCADTPPPPYRGGGWRPLVTRQVKVDRVIQGVEGQKISYFLYFLAYNHVPSLV
jgi:hypothetical protein